MRALRVVRGDQKLCEGVKEAGAKRCDLCTKTSVYHTIAVSLVCSLSFSVFRQTSIEHLQRHIPVGFDLRTTLVRGALLLTDHVIRIRDVFQL